MNDDILSRERVYQPRDVSSFIGIGTSTLRKWCLLLEKEGYDFTRDDNNRRVYSDHDVMSLKRFDELTKEGLMSLSNAAIALAQRSGASDTQEETHVIEAEQSGIRAVDRFDELMTKIDELVENGKQRDELIRKQDATIQAMMLQSDKQERTISKAMSDRNQQHSDLIMELAEIKEQMNESKKPGMFGRLFKR